MLRRSSSVTLKYLFFLIIFVATSFEISYCATINSHHEDETLIMCPEIEKRALVSFKQSLKDPYDQFFSWNDEVNCCMWKGVVCNNSTGHVHELHLRGCYNENASPETHGLRGKINSSLLNLKYLNYLDLSQNDFQETIPSFIGSLVKLEYLNLSHAGFYGAIPRTIGNLSNLRALSLQSDDFTGTSSDNLDWLSGLFRLEQLNMNSVDLSKASNWLHVLNTLPSLSELRLRGCELDWSASIDSVNFSSLRTLDLSQNEFDSLVLPRWTLQLKGLTFLDLSENIIAGPIPSISNTTELEFIDLSDNLLNSTIPDWLYSCSNLEYVYLHDNSLFGSISTDISNLSSLTVLDLSRNNFHGSVPPGVWRSCKMHSLDLSLNKLHGEMSDFIGNMSDCFIGSLEYLYLRRNQICGHISNRFGNLKNLRDLDLGWNSISGAIPFILGELSYLESLYLHNNKFVGNLPETLGKLSNMRCFDASKNSLEGVVTENHLINLKNLQFLDLSWNSISGAIPFVIGELSSLEFLYLGINKFVGNLPKTLGKLLNLISFDVSSNSLEGVVTESHFINLKNITEFDASGNQLTFKVSPNWIPPFQLSFLRLQSTNISGPFPAWLITQKNIEFLDLSNSGIHGLIPRWVWNIPNFDLSANNLYGNIPNINFINHFSSRAIDLSSNRFSGTLPRIAKNVVLFDLSNNSISGGISNVICDNNTTEPYALWILDLSANQLSGELPGCWMRMKNLKVFHLGDNDMNGTIPSSIKLLKGLQLLNLCNNRFSGHIPPSIFSSTALMMIDLSGNYFYGNHPKWTKLNSDSLRFVILRSNKLSDRIDSNICSITSIQILDISNNNLYGTIPSCFSNFTLLAHDTIMESYSPGDVATGAILKRELPYFTSGYIYSYAGFLSSTAFYLGFMSVTVTTKGQEHSYDVLLPLVTSIDLSNNNLSGTIPLELTRLARLRQLNLSRNHLTGSIPSDIGDMKQLESLDLSLNSLTGEIPSSFTVMSYLNYLNLSYNNLTGRIPESTQLQSMNASSFVGNNLCGPPLTASKCGAQDADDDDANKDNIVPHGVEVDWFIVLLSLGYAVGLSSFCIVMFFHRSLRIAYFGMLRDIWEKIMSSLKRNR